MLSAINFYHYLFGKADKINDIISYWLLPSKFKSLYLSSL